MIEGRNIICFGPSDWWGMNPSCATHIMSRFTAKNKVLYINPFSSDFSGGTKSGMSRRIARKIKSIVKCLKRPAKRLYVFSPVFIPLQGRPIIDAINNVFLKLQIKLVCLFLGFSKPVLWMENVRAADALDWFDNKIVIYHVSDLFEECNYVSNKNMSRVREQKISESSDVLICVSRRLYETKAGQRENVFYLPHGVDFELFRQAANNDNEVAEELAGIPKPIAGYYGTLTASNDVELLRYCATRLPDVSFVLAGEITGGDYVKLLKLRNVYHLGKIPYKRIPFICAGFDVCLLQWKVDKWIRFCNPLKFFEYMASGRPIVSVPIDEVAMYSDVVSIAQNEKEFCDAIVLELHNDATWRAAKRIDIAREHSWDSHIERLSEIITGAIDAKR